MIALPTGVESLRGMVQITVYRDGTIVLDRGEVMIDPDTHSTSVPHPFRSLVSRVDDLTVVTSESFGRSLPDSSTRRAPGALSRALAWLLTGKGRP